MNREGESEGGRKEGTEALQYYLTTEVCSDGNLRMCTVLVRILD